jgi:hypothetical protein
MRGADGLARGSDHQFSSKGPFPALKMVRNKKKTPEIEKLEEAPNPRKIRYKKNSGD